MPFLDNPASSLTEGRKVVAAAGTAEQLSSSGSRVRGVTITAETDNTGIIVVGGSGVVASLSTRKGTPLNAGDTATIPVSQLSAVWLDSTVTGDGVTYTAEIA